jgi:hypothetical protein
MSLSSCAVTAWSHIFLVLISFMIAGLVALLWAWNGHSGSPATVVSVVSVASVGWAGSLVSSSSPNDLEVPSLTFLNVIGRERSAKGHSLLAIRKVGKVYLLIKHKSICLFLGWTLASTHIVHRSYHTMKQT